MADGQALRLQEVAAMKILVVGILCAGQRTMLNALTKAGYNIGMDYEDPKSDGVVLTHDSETLSVCKADIVIHLVRDPLTAIPLMQKASNVRISMAIAAQLWYVRNIQIESMTSILVRVEALQECWPVTLMRPSAFAGATSSRAKAMQLKVLEKSVPNMERIVALAKHYGYVY